MCSWAQEEIWKISSNVPRPPGKAMKASAWLNIAFNRSYIVETCSSSPIVFPMMSPFVKASGTTPKTWLPHKNTAIATPPINPRLPPPYTKWIFLSANTWPRWFADSKNSFSFQDWIHRKHKYLWCDDLRNLQFLHTSIFVKCMGWVEMKGRKRRFYRWEIEDTIIPPIFRPAGVAHSLSIYLFILKKHVYVQVVVIVAHIFPWFYVQERFKRRLWVGDRLPIQFS
jgi:hypothetical protein